MNSWMEIPSDSDFSIQNLPYGIFSRQDGHLKAGIAVGDQIIDLDILQATGALDEYDLEDGIFRTGSLNEFIAKGRPVWRKLRRDLQSWLTAEKGKTILEPCLVSMNEAKMHLPVQVGDYTDFYSSEEHATNVGKMFRDPDNALLPNWKHMPVAYHGRSSSIVISGTPIHRPKGQKMPPGAESPVFGTSNLLDIELEMAFIVGKDTQLGETVSTAAADEHIFGMVVFNDWSARDIQKWEYVPLGPFLGKNFGSSISPWVVTLDALEPFRIQGPVQDPPVLPYLQYEGNRSFDIDLEVYLQPEGGEEEKISHSNCKHLYWNIAQQLAHHTVNGCNIKVGDMCASGTISGPERSSFGSLLEITWRGEQPLKLKDGTERKFLLDHDTVIMRAYSERDGIRVGFGEVRTQILPAL